MATGVLFSCTNDTDTAEAYLNGTAKTPIAVRTSLGDAPASRAFDKTFETGDLLFAYIEAGKLVGGTFTPTPVDQFTWKNNFTLGETVDNGGAAGVGNITSSDKLSPVLYWDDFSSTQYDLREVGRGIRLKYGYCFNGNEAGASNKSVENGTLTWTIETNQSAATGADMKKSDLLYAATQGMVTYAHEDGSRGQLALPYTHAMSKITINVTTGEGFKAETANFQNSVLTLKNMQTVANVNAPAAKVTVPDGSPSGIADVITYINSKENTAATYQAIIGPTNLSAGNILAHITDIDGNAYDIPVTAAMLEAWRAEDRLIKSEEEIQNGVAQAKSRAGSIPHGQGYITKQGIHYILDVTVDKQKIKIRATITDWDRVQAYGKADINFTGDVTEKGTIAEELKANGFDVYKSSVNTAFPTTQSTRVTFTSGEWKYSPTIYWAGQGDSSYFRALSPKGASTSTLTQGIDLLWGTSGDDVITPRTGDVELKFCHLMSKLCINLETSDDASQVDLTDAKIKITNLARTGTYNIVDGSMSNDDAEDVMISDKLSGFNEAVIPQNIADDARLIITLKDGTTYSLQLNNCLETGTDTAVNEWLSGKFYTYNIYLVKERITFRAKVKEWDDVEGSGNANLEWD